MGPGMHGRRGTARMNARLAQHNRYMWCLVALGFASMLGPLRLLQVRGASMEPTLHNGRRYVLDRFYYRLNGLHVGDVVVANPDGDEIVKRVVGLPGDRMQQSG